MRQKNKFKIFTITLINYSYITTEPGKERADVREGSKLINTLKTIVKF